MKNLKNRTSISSMNWLVRLTIYSMDGVMNYVLRLINVFESIIVIDGITFPDEADRG